jgi:exopolysaccharide production protein ExoQ
MMLGGSGSLFPEPEIILQCFMAVLTCAWFVGLAGQTPPGRGLRGVPRGAWIIAALLVALPLGQLLPLPPAIWHSLPGRSMEAAALDLVGQRQSWRPLSLTPNRTLASLLVMAAAAASLVMCAAQDRKGRTILLSAVVGVALISILVGAAQLSGGAGNGFRFYYPDEAFLDGFQTNHNAQADVLLIALVALAAIAADWAESREQPVAGGQLLAMVGGISALLVLGVVLTASRTGIALLLIAFSAQLLILRRWLGPSRRLAPGIAVAALATIGLAAAGLRHNTVLIQSLARFKTPTEVRPEIWHDAVFAMQLYWPWGAGMGSFVPVFAAVERLEVVTSHFVNRAHNDYLELLIEAGLPGVLVLGLIGHQLITGARQSLRLRAAASRPQIICGAANLLILALHSLIDYPLRTMSLASIAALHAALLLPGPGRPSPEILPEFAKEP